MINKATKFLVRDIARILKEGYKDENPRPKYEDGTPAHTISVNQNIRTYNLNKGEFPICSLRPIAWKSAIREIFTIYQKPTNVISEMKEMKVGWWSEWDIGDGTIGQRYGATVKRYDLVNNLIKDIKEDPFGRRKIMSLWQEADLRETAGLAPCAFLTMWNVRQNPKGKNFLDMTLVQRSGDMLVASGAGCVNEVQYAALLMMIARHCDLLPGMFVHFVQNEQIYDRHIEQAKTLVKRCKMMLGDEQYRVKKYKRPYLKLKKDVNNFFEMTIDDFEMVNYEPIEPQLKFELGI